MRNEAYTGNKCWPSLDCPKALEVELTPSHKFRTPSFLTVVDQPESEMSKWLEVYKLFDECFRFLNQLETLGEEKTIVRVVCKIFVGRFRERDNNSRIFTCSLNRIMKKKQMVMNKERWIYKPLLDHPI